MLDRIGRPRTGAAIIAMGLLGELFLLYVFAHLGRDLRAEAYGPRAHDDRHTAAMLSMMALSFVSTVALAMWLLTYLRSPSVLWHWGQLGLVVFGSFGVAWVCWMHLGAIAANGMSSQGPVDFMLYGFVAALCIGAVAVPLALAWRWFGSRA